MEEYSLEMYSSLKINMQAWQKIWNSPLQQKSFIFPVRSQVGMDTGLSRGTGFQPLLYYKQCLTLTVFFLFSGPLFPHQWNPFHNFCWSNKSWAPLAWLGDDPRENQWRPGLEQIPDLELFPVLLTSHKYQLSTHSVLGIVECAVDIKMEEQGPSPPKPCSLARETHTIKVIYQCPKNPFPAHHHSIV